MGRAKILLSKSLNFVSFSKCNPFEKDDAFQQRTVFFQWVTAPVPGILNRKKTISPEHGKVPTHKGVLKFQKSSNIAHHTQWIFEKNFKALSQDRSHIQGIFKKSKSPHTHEISQKKSISSSTGLLNHSLGFFS